MSVYSYVVDRDYGFAPNPFYGICTLATCKPDIRRKASIGDWVIGTGGARRRMSGRLIYAMKISEALSFDEYFNDHRFQFKKPNLSGSLKQCFGDNIYSQDVDGDWQQLDSHHSLRDGSPNPENVIRDTGTNRLLLASEFTYFGADAPLLPEPIRSRGPDGICCGRYHRVTFEQDSLDLFFDWYSGFGPAGRRGKPLEWLKNGGMVRGS